MMDQSGGQAALGVGDQSKLIVEPGHWVANGEPAAGAKASASRAAAAGLRHICRGISFTLASTNGGSAEGPLLVRLRDGASGAGTVLASWAVSALVGDSRQVTITGLSLVGSVNTAMTLEFSAAPAGAASQETCTLEGYDTSGG